LTVLGANNELNYSVPLYPFFFCSKYLPNCTNRNTSQCRPFLYKRKMFKQ